MNLNAARNKSHGLISTVRITAMSMSEKYNIIKNAAKSFISHLPYFYDYITFNGRVN